MSNNLWRKEVLLIANLLPAIVNFFTSILLAKFIGFELAGLWFFLRSLSQISVSVNPGFLQALLIKGNNFTFTKNILSIAKILAITWSIVNFFIFILFLNLLGKGNGLISYLTCFYWISLSIFNYFAIILRINLDGKSMLMLSIADVLISLFILTSLFYLGLEWFIFFNGLKFFIKAYLAKYLLDKKKEISTSKANLTIHSYLISSKELFNIGGGLSFKGIIQTISQYGDKFIFGLILTNEMLGFISLGSTLGLPLAILMSSFYTWSLPFLNDKNYLSNNSKIFLFLLLLLLLYPLSSFTIYLIYDLSAKNFLIVLCGLIFMVLQIILNFSCALLFKKYGTWLSSLLQLIIIVICYLLVYLYYQWGFELYFALSIGSLFLVIVSTCVLFIPFKNKSFYLLLFGLHLIYPLFYS